MKSANFILGLAVVFYGTLLVFGFVEPGVMRTTDLSSDPLGFGVLLVIFGAWIAFTSKQWSSLSMKMLWKYAIPIVLIVVGVFSLGDDPSKPYSQTIPIALGVFQRPLAWILIATGIAIAILLAKKRVD
jgi:hypothetical protein